MRVGFVEWPESLIADIRLKIEQRADADTLKPLLEELRGVLVLISQDAQRQPAGARAGGGGTESEAASGDASSSSSSSSKAGGKGDDDIIDADIAN